MCSKRLLSSDVTTDLVAKITSIAEAEDRNRYVVEFWVGREIKEDATLPQALALLGNINDLQRKSYSMAVVWEGDELVMEPDEALAECLALFDRFASCEQLELSFAVQWKTGQLAESILSRLVHANVLGIWRTGEPIIRQAEPMLETKRPILD